LNKNTEVVVIGGGIIGASIAYYLTKRGIEVILIEKREGLSFGASGAGQGGCPIQLFESPILELAKESQKLYKNLVSEVEYDIEYENTGSLICTVNREQIPAIEKHFHKKRKEGLDVKMIEEDEIQELEPDLSEDIVLAVEEKEASIVNPFKVNYLFAYLAKKQGAEVLLSTEVKDIKIDNNKVKAVITSSGEIKTNFIVDATGAWSSKIGKMIGINIPIRPRRGQIIVTEPVPLNKRWRYILDADYLTTAFDLEAIEKSGDPRIKLGVAGSYVQENTGNWTIGSSRDFSDYDNKTTPQTLKYMAKRAIKFLPKLKHINCIRTFAGLRPYCYVDGLPIIDKVDFLGGFIMATGHAGEGITLAPITGKIVSELIAEGRTSMPIDAFSFSRFKDMS